MATAAKKTKKEPTIGQRIDAMKALRDQKRILESQVKDIEEKYAAEEAELMVAMETAGLQKSTGTLASAGITTNVVANIVDWDALCAYVKKKGHFHLFQRRISDPAARELFEHEGKVPGLEPFTKKKLTLTSLKS